MKIIISPAKKMKVNTDTLEVRALPVYLHEAEYLRQYLSELSYEELKSLWKCNDQIAQINYERVQTMNLRMHLTPALLSYEGIQYQYMAPAVLEDGQWEYVQEHVCILSGFYGVVHPLDGVTPYRLEMQTKVNLPNVKNLYEYWGEKIYREVSADTEVIVNLASKEYSKCVEKYLTPEIRYITCVFAEYKGDKVIEKGTYAKMARGEMVRFLAERKAERPEEMKSFCRLGYRYSEKESTKDRYVFLKEQGGDK
ncbi:MAG: peroxide stress protein YaaA [Lachnospiraceae bacterium]